MKKLLCTLLALCSFSSFAHVLEVGAALPDTTVDDKGSLLYDGSDFTYRPWMSSEIKGKVFALQVIAGRTSSSELNDPMIQAIKEANFSAETFKMITIINTDDAIWGTSGFVKGAIEDNKKQYPDAEFVVDDSSSVHNKWQLEEKSSAIIILDQKGDVLFVKDGKMDESEISRAITLIEKNS